MYDFPIAKLARLMTQYSTSIVPGDLVGIRYDPMGEPLALALYQEAIRAGGNVQFRTAPEGATEAFFELANDDQLTFPHPAALAYAELTTVDLGVMAPANTRALAAMDPLRLSRAGVGRKPVQQLFMERQGTGDLRWSLTQFPTQAAAQEAGMSLEQFARFIAQAGMLHLEDPVAFWMKFDRWQQGVVDWLNDGRNMIWIASPNIDLHLSVTDRVWVNASGKKNFPDGEVFTGPVETSANGWLQTTFPQNYHGNVVEGIRLEFKDGRVVNATATKGEDFLRATLAEDDGASILGELGIGTHNGITQPTGAILFDEKMGHTVHLAVGAGYPDTGNTNESSVHWDMIVELGDTGFIDIDGTTVYSKGEFTIGNRLIKPDFNS